jgi:hypothetical protein
VAEIAALADPKRFTSIEGMVVSTSVGWSNDPLRKCAMSVAESLSGEIIENLPAAGLKVRPCSRVRITIEVIR